MDTLKSALTDLTKMLHESNIKYAVIGGLAVSARGYIRVTEDIDVVVACDWDDATELLLRVRDNDRAAATFDEAASDIESILAQGLLIPLIHHESCVPVDIAVGLSGFEQQAVRRAQIVDIAGLQLPVVVAEDLIVFKLVGGRPRDLTDIEGILRISGTELDWDSCSKIARQIDAEISLGLVDQIEQLRSEFE